MKRLQVQVQPSTSTSTSTSVLELEKVKQFLDSVGRNSSNSKKIYGIGLGHFQSFIKNKYSPATVETVLDAKWMTDNRINMIFFDRCFCIPSYNQRAFS